MMHHYEILLPLVYSWSYHCHFNTGPSRIQADNCSRGEVFCDLQAVAASRPAATSLPSSQTRTSVPAAVSCGHDCTLLFPDSVMAEAAQPRSLQQSYCQLPAAVASTDSAVCQHVKPPLEGPCCVTGPDSACSADAAVQPPLKETVPALASSRSVKCASADAAASDADATSSLSGAIQKAHSSHSTGTGLASSAVGAPLTSRSWQLDSNCLVDSSTCGGRQALQQSLVCPAIPHTAPQQSSSSVPPGSVTQPASQGPLLAPQHLPSCLATAENAAAAASLDGSSQAAAASAACQKGCCPSRKGSYGCHSDEGWVLDGAPPALPLQKDDGSRAVGNSPEALYPVGITTYTEVSWMSPTGRKLECVIGKLVAKMLCLLAVLW